jgi:mono/diheme cytochrome c family protein
VKHPQTALALVLMFTGGVAAAQAPPRGDALNGRKIYVSYGCYQCHGHQGQGSNAGSRLAPGPVPYTAFVYQVRQPRVRMPAYSLKIVSDQEVADIYAYLLTMPKAMSVAEIPLLNGAPIKDESSK